MRAGGRRAVDRRRIVVFDRYPPSLILLSAVVLMLSLLDAVFTLILIAQGAQELNPVMNYFLSRGPHLFLVVKYGLTALSVLIVVVAHEAILSRYRAGVGILPVFAALFGAVVVWELYLLSRL
jgi:hypothetical protein